MKTTCVRLAVALVLGNFALLAASAQGPFRGSNSQRPAGSPWPKQAPTRIYVTPFHLDPKVAAQVAKAEAANPVGAARKNVDSRPRVADAVSGNDRSAPVGDNIAKQVVKDLNDARVPAVYWNQPTAPPQDGWRLTGQVVGLDEGHKAAQNVIGLGAGNKKVAVDVALSDPNTAGGQSFFLIDTSDKGRHMPGAAPLAVIRGFNPISIATKVVVSESGVKDVSQQNKIASEISKEIVTAMKQHGQYHHK
jgi:hypothetical protein